MEPIDNIRENLNERNKPKKKELKKKITIDDENIDQKLLYGGIRKSKTIYKKVIDDVSYDEE